MSITLPYAALMLAAAAMFFLARRCFPDSSSGLATVSREERRTILLAAFIGGVLGAKLPFVFVRGADWFGTAWLADGKTVTTGLIGAYIAVEFVKLLYGIKSKTGDSFALPLALALAVGRWGCFLHGCCFGVPTQLPWGVDFGDGIARHPTQAYESLFHFSMAMMLIQIVRREWFRNQRLKVYLISYGIYRFLTEYIRPEPVYAIGLTYFQLVALFMVTGLVMQWGYETYSQFLRSYFSSDRILKISQHRGSHPTIPTIVEQFDHGS
jgi:phosphatidylglycerol:prolipoprotein diacylglycerol transferase